MFHVKQAPIIGEIFHKSKITEHLKELKRDCTMKQIIHSAVCRNPDCHPMCRTYLSTSYRSCSNDSNRNNCLASAHLREQATIEKTDIVKRCPKRERRTPTLLLILTFGSKKFAKRNERILSQHRCSMPSS